jgi:hypothetical protein
VTWLHNYAWLAAVSSGTAVLAALARPLVLLVGFLATLHRSAESDRPKIFGEFARAIASIQKTCRRSRHQLWGRLDTWE